MARLWSISGVGTQTLGRYLQRNRSASTRGSTLSVLMLASAIALVVSRWSIVCF
jgi:hypothetical protein